jgi:hypothetical protein
MVIIMWIVGVIRGNIRVVTTFCVRSMVGGTVTLAAGTLIVTSAVELSRLGRSLPNQWLPTS